MSDVRKNWLLCIFSVFFLWGLTNTIFAVAAKVFHGHALIFSCAAFTGCALSLLIIGKSGALAKETIRSIETWGYGLFLLFVYVLAYMLKNEVSATEATLIQRLSVIASLLLSWFFFVRVPGKLQLLFAATMFGAIVSIIIGEPTDVMGKIILIAIVFSLMQALYIFIAENHKTHAIATQNKKQDPKARARVVGFIMFAVSVFFTSITLVLALFNELFNTVQLAGLPTLADYTNGENILLGLFTGVLLLAPMRYIEFASASSIKTENYLALTSLAALSTFMYEELFALFTPLPINTLSTEDMVAGVVIVVSGVGLAFSKLSASSTLDGAIEEYVQDDSQDPEAIADSREILANTLEHFDGSVSKSAEALNMPEVVIQALLNDQKRTLSFTPKSLKNVARSYRRNVALSDALTGLTNRAGFMTALKTAEYETPIYSVLYIDLDKFKPVNDTYGHDAGDFVLKGVAERLGELFPKDALSTRLGGDEFATLLLGKTKEEAHYAANLIKEELAKAFHFNDTAITIGASIGVATFPEDGSDAETLLKVADQGMYSGKLSR